MNAFNNLNMSKKIVGLVGILLLLMMISTGFGIFKMSGIGTELTEIAENDMPLTEKITEITVNQLEQAIWFERALRFGGIGKDKHNFEIAEEHFIKLAHLVDEEIKEGEHLAQKAIDNAKTKAGKVEFEEILKHLKVIENEHSNYDLHAEEVFELINNGDMHEAEILAKKVEAEEEALDHELKQFLKQVAGFTQESLLHAEHAEQSAITGMIVIALIALVFGVGLSILIVRAIVGPIREIIATINVLETGDLTKRINVNSENEIGQMSATFNTFLDGLNKTLNSMASASQTLASSSEQMSASSKQIATGTEEQSEKASQVATASQEMSATVIEVAENASGASAAAKEANNAAIKGGDIVFKTIQSMNGISETAKESSEVISNLGERSKEIGNIVKVIDDIADQTNLLALNAAIEAARAGEQGRGFAVVADEVRTLAEKTTKATKEIGDMIKGMQDDTGKAVETMENEVRVVEEGVLFAQEAGASLQEIVGDVEKVNMMIDQIATASEEQSTAADQISSDIDAVAEITRDNSVGVGEIATAGNDVAEMASNLQSLVQEFKLN